MWYYKFVKTLKWLLLLIMSNERTIRDIEITMMRSAPFIIKECDGMMNERMITIKEKERFQESL